MSNQHPQQVTDIYYRIRFPGKVGTDEEYYISNSGNTRWSSLTQIKSLITMGIPCGYQNRLRKKFEDVEGGYEVIEVIDVIKRTETIIIFDKPNLKVKRRKRKVNNTESIELNTELLSNDNNNNEED
jgi:hypothetical protein